MSEKIPSPEIARQEVVEALRRMRESGKDDPEAKELLVKWTIQEEEKVPNMPEGPIEHNLKRARLYYEAGYHDEALENFDAALYQAEQEVLEDLRQKIENEIRNFSPS